METRTVDLETITAVVDTNVMLDIYTGTDLINAYDEIGNGDLDHPDLVYRRTRARDGLLLAIYLHEQKAITYSLHNELTSNTLRAAPPTDQDDFKLHYTMFFVHFVKDRILGGWEPSFGVNNDEGLKGTSCDTLLLKVACENRLPLITNEGFGPGGVDESDQKKLRARGKQVGVDVRTPREFIAGRIDDAEAIQRFLSAFTALAPAYISSHPKPDVADESLRAIHAAYQHVLLGMVDDQVGACRVTMKD